MYFTVHTDNKYLFSFSLSFSCMIGSFVAFFFVCVCEREREREREREFCFLIELHWVVLPKSKTSS